ncbi:MAG: class I SAM-dependent methyltransferase [Anaerolineae bacterium]
MLSALLSPGVILKSVEPHIFSVFPDSDPVHQYDRSVVFYDRVIGNPVYNRLLWGYSISEFADFARAALSSETSGWVLDAGCGSLVFTAGTYANISERPVVMLDQSIQMLRAAKSRLIELRTEVPPNIVFLQGDVLQLPFRRESFSMVISMNVLHVLDEAEAMIDDLWKVLAPGGRLSVTSLILGRSVGDQYLRLLHRSGGIASPRDSRQVLAAFSEVGIPTSHYVRGNMMFIHSV